MKKLVRILTATVLSVAFMGSVASASTCDNISITGTGPGSNNTVDCNVVTNITYTCNNGVLVLNYNGQGATSGSATVDYNTNAGAAVTGTITNDNNIVTDLATACGPVSTPETPVTPGSGSVTPAQKVAVLPYTAANSTLAIVAGSLAIAASVVIISRLAVAAYRRASLK